MDSSEAQSFLNSFTNFESQLHKLRPEDFNLSRIEELLDLTGDPAKNLKVIHVAGTKGKGSTCAFLASILQEAGYKVGLYTSPHLHKLNERIRILDGKNPGIHDDFSGSIPDEELSAVLRTLRPFAATIQNEGRILTYFEVLTVAALMCFARARVDIVILETGLGGRLDATNAVNSLIAIITPVSMDHTKILGSTLGKIAAEKAGIIKNSHQQVVIAPQEKTALDVILHRCREFGIKPVLVTQGGHENLKIGLKGMHQMINAACALEAVTILKTMGFKIADKAIDGGLKNVRWPGRFELLSKNPDVIVDCAHNEASAKALALTLKEEFSRRKVILILGISEDKDAGAICNSLKAGVGHIIFTKANHPRSHQFTQGECIKYLGEKPFEIIDALSKTLKRALEIAQAQDLILVTGSIFVVAETREFISCTSTKA